MTIAHAFRLARDLDPHGSAEALTSMCQHFSCLSQSTLRERRISGAPGRARIVLEGEV